MGYHGFNQGDQLLPKIFNVMLDVVVRHWLMIMAEKAVGPEGFYHAVQKVFSLFYTDNVLPVLTMLECLQWVLYILIGPFDWLVLQTNVQKKLVLVCQSCCINGRHTYKAYKWSITVDYT